MDRRHKIGLASDLDGQLIKSLDRERIVEMSREHGGERYVKGFDGYTHLLTMLYAVIELFDSLREIEASMTAEVRKLEDVYRDLYESNKDRLTTDSRRNTDEK